MERINIIKTIGEDFLTSNIENGEFSYAKALNESIRGHKFLDIRFYDEKAKVAVLVETKQKFNKIKDKEQLFAYVDLEKELSARTKIIAILANTVNDSIKVWKITDEFEDELDDRKLKSFAEYIDYFKPKNVNDKSTVLENTSRLNCLLLDNGIQENLRSQFVGTCLLALKNGLIYKGLPTEQIIAGIKGVLEKLLEGSLEKADKIVILHENILKDQNVEKIKSDNFEKILTFIEKNIVPYINEASREGHDILSYFFTTFNKYVNRGDKNQAFTPNHISHFMAKVAGIYKTSRVLDPTCGSGTFLVQAMTQALNDCETEAERKAIKKNQIFGIEFDKNVYGLSTTNMLIHGDGNSNIRCKSCFELGDWIEQSNIDVVLMNPPYNASKNQVPEKYAATWTKSTDPSKGLFFVEFIANKVGKGRLLTLLPMSCAITTAKNNVIRNLKEKMLEKHTLDAVFSMPGEMFYPGASSVACCMVFDLGKPHKKDKETFFGYFKDDGFEKRKGIGRVDARNKWEAIEKEWLYLYEHRATVVGKSITKCVTADDEWCAEAYMETDYTPLCEANFLMKMRDYTAFTIGRSNPYDLFNYTSKPLYPNKLELNVKDWQWFIINDIFNVNAGTYHYSEEYSSGKTPYVSATAVNNGIAQYIDLEADFDEFAVTNEKINCTAFYQPIPFCATSDVNILRRKDGVTINKYVGLFLATLIDFNEGYRWNYGRQCRVGDTQAIRLKLPAIKNAKGEYEPDWQWMEDYIKGLPYSGCL